MAKWVSLQDDWSVQNVQAGLNVVIAFLCAGAIFVLVRYCWLLAARRIAHKKDVPAYTLLSLNTIGETVDVIWLLRHDLFSKRYRGLLIQCIFVMMLTVATLMSGFIARWSTRWGTVVKERQTNGTLAERSTGSILYAEVDNNQTMAALQFAKFPPNQLLEYLPNPEVQWNYVPEQWNSSWKMDCTFNRSTEIPNPRATGNCSTLGTEFPPLYNNYWDWDATEEIANTTSWGWTNTGWRNTRTEWRDTIIFTHGIRYADWHEDLSLYASLEMRTVAIYMENAPWNSSLPSTCTFAEGPIDRAFYTSCNCMLTRDIAGRTTEDLYYGAYPDWSDVNAELSAHLDHYGNRFRKESSREQKVTVIEGEELAMFYQAYQITKDTIVSPFVFRPVDNYVRTPQVSMICLVLCAIALAVLVFGFCSYWIFLWRHWHKLYETPQSKLDWMLHNIRRADDNKTLDRHRLSVAMASGADKTEAFPLNRMDKEDHRSIKSTVSSHAGVSPELHQGDDGFDTSVLSSNFSGRAPVSTWFPQQYERVSGHGRQQSFGQGYANEQFSPPQQQSPYAWQPAQYGDTAYDPGRR